MIKLSKLHKICFAIGGIPHQMTDSAIHLFFQVFLLFVVRLSPTEVAIILFSGRVWDAISDPVVGWLIAKSPYTRLGKLIPWIFVSAPLAAVNYIGLWTRPLIRYPVYYYIFMYCMFQTLQTCFRIPYLSLTVVLGKTQEERDSLTTYRTIAEIIGMLIGVIFQVYVINDPIHCNRTTNETLIQEKFVTITSGTSSALYIICAITLITAILGKESPQPFSVKISNYKKILTFKPYVKLIIGFLFTSTAFLLIQGNFALFCNQTLKLGKNCRGIILTIVVSSALSIPLWKYCLKKFGKYITMNIGAVSGIPCIILMVCMVPTLTTVYIFAISSGLCIGAALFLPWSILPDIIVEFMDEFCVDDGVGVLFYSLYIFFAKLFTGLMMAISTLLLRFVNYNADLCFQPQEAQLFLKLFLSSVPISFIIIGLTILNLKI